MGNFRQPRQRQHGSEEQAPIRVGLDPCAADGCPLPGTIKTESGTRVCGGHFYADRAGWPKATAVLSDHHGLWVLAREAGTSCAPDCADEAKARILFQAAKAAGLVFNDPQRERYKLAGMKYRAAGAIAEAMIVGAAAAATGVVLDRAA